MPNSDLVTQLMNNSGTVCKQSQYFTKEIVHVMDDLKLGVNIKDVDELGPSYSVLISN